MKVIFQIKDTQMDLNVQGTAKILKARAKLNKEAGTGSS